jgi:glycosyltransferase involved in cell wall biosynthesis
MFEFELVLPAYNEAESLQSLVTRVVKAAEEAGFDAARFQLVVVNNGSTDNSSDVLRELQASDLGRWFRVETVARNQGYGFGLWSGLRRTTAPFVGWSHADMQCAPKDAFKALEVVRDAHKQVLVKGTRSGRNWKDKFVSRVFETFARVLLGMNIYEINAQPKVFPRALLDKMVEPPKTFAFDLYALYNAQKAGFEVETIPVLFPPRIHGASKWAASFFGRYKTILGMIHYMWELNRSEGRL